MEEKRENFRAAVLELSVEYAECLKEPILINNIVLVNDLLNESSTMLEKNIPFNTKYITILLKFTYEFKVHTAMYEATKKIVYSWKEWKEAWLNNDS